MIKNFKFFLLFLFLYSCGYSPIYEVNKKLNFKLDVTNYSGDKKIGREIEKGLEKFKNNKTQNIFDAEFIIMKKEEIISKDKKGDPTALKTTIEVDLNLLNKTNNKTFTKKFTKETTYDSMDNKFELNQYKINVEKNMVLKILQDIGIFFNIIENDL
mgnify:CR=1 FL=1